MRGASNVYVYPLMAEAAFDVVKESLSPEICKMKENRKPKLPSLVFLAAETYSRFQTRQVIVEEEDTAWQSLSPMIQTLIRPVTLHAYNTHYHGHMIFGCCSLEYQQTMKEMSRHFIYVCSSRDVSNNAWHIDYMNPMEGHCDTYDPYIKEEGFLSLRKNTNWYKDYKGKSPAVLMFYYEKGHYFLTHIFEGREYPKYCFTSANDSDTCEMPEHLQSAIEKWASREKWTVEEKAALLVMTEAVEIPVEVLDALETPKKVKRKDDELEENNNNKMPKQVSRNSTDDEDDNSIDKLWLAAHKYMLIKQGPAALRFSIPKLFP